MKKIIQLSIIIFSLLSSYHIASSDDYTVASAPHYVENCQNLQTAFDIAIQAHEQGIKAATIVQMQLPFHQKDLVHCRKNYQLQHPGVFEKTPAIITENKDGLIQILIISRKEADDLMKSY